MLLTIAVAFTLLFAFVNGFHDGCNVVATIIGSRSMSPRRAILLATLFEFVGPVLLGTAVAATIANRILKPEFLAGLDPTQLHVLVIASVGSAILWNLVTWAFGLPSSSSHALIGGIIGAGFAQGGSSIIDVKHIVERIVVPLFTSPIIGFVIGALAFHFIRTYFGRASRGVGHLFTSLQAPGMLFLAASHGSNDAQKSMGVIALALAAGRGTLESPPIPEWVIASSAAAIALGMSTGGWSIIKTVGFSIFRMQPVHSFASQFSSASVILTASILGGPVSTTQVVASSVMGVGASRRLSGVRWSVARNIVQAWLLTIPISAAIAAGACWLLARHFV